MWKKLARGAFLAFLAVMAIVWVASMAASSASEPPPYDPDVYWLA